MKKTLLITLFVALFVTACAAGEAKILAGPKIAVEGAWGRPSPKVATAGAFYMTIRNTGSQADKLTGARSVACGTVELHESYLTPEGAMGMRPVPGGVIEIPAGGAVELKVGGLHVMCIDKKVPFDPGTKILLILTFEKSGNMIVEAEIREQ